MTILETERSAKKRISLDRATPAALVRLVLKGGEEAIQATRRSRSRLATAASLVADTYRAGGRIFFVGAGTSGRICAQEAAECRPTFGVPRARVDSILAGGRRMLWRAVEGAEDDAAAARKAVARRKIGRRDCLVGVSASGATRFVAAALRSARKRGARIVFVTSNPQAISALKPDVAVLLRTGPEVLAGSTRLKAGTAAKLALNAITTAGMSLAGRTFGNLMVDLRPTSRKLRDRAVRIVMEICRVGRQRAARLLRMTEGNPKLAALTHRKNVTVAEAKRLLATHGGSLRKALMRNS